MPLKQLQVRAMRSWWPWQLLLGWLQLVLAAPLIYLYAGLPMVLREQGWSGTDIGWLQLTGMAAMLKFALAMPVDRWPLGRANYRNWAVLLVLAYAAVLVSLALLPLKELPMAGLLGLAVLVSALATWVDVPVNALAIECLPESERMRAGAVRSAALSLGAVLGGGAMLLVYAQAGWRPPWMVLALGLLSAAVLLLLCPWPAVRHGGKTDRVQVSLRQGLAWFSVPPYRSWAWLLLLYFPLIGAAWVYLKPLLLDQGMAAGSIAGLVGLGGGVLAAFGSLLGSRLSRRAGAHRSLLAFALANVLVLAWLWATVAWNLGHAALVTAALLLALMVGACGGLLFGLTMCHTRSGLAALDYGIQSSLFVAGRTLMPLLAGWLLDRAGYGGMLLCLTVGSALVVVLVWQLRGQVLTAEGVPR